MANASRIQKASVRPRVRRGSEEDAAQLRSELLTAAATLFERGGLDAVTIRAVANLVGVSAMTPYNYFEDKAHLMQGLCLQVIGHALEAIRAASRDAPDARERIRRSVGAFIAYWEANPQHYKLVYMTEQTVRAEEAGKYSESPVYAAILDENVQACVELARELGGDLGRVKLAGDVRFMMVSGYLHAHLVNRRYAWSEPIRLRARYIEEIIAAMERCLLS